MVPRQEIRPNGISGIMRVKNDGPFILKCVDTCIDALDELIIVWNDCSDNSKDIIEKARQKHPDKIKTFEYKHKIYSINLTEDEYNYVKSLPSDSPHLLCNYYNFALSKTTYRYAVKIDADQYYFSKKFARICDMVKNPKTNLSLSVIFGFFVYILFRLNRKLSHLTQKYIVLYPLHQDMRCWSCYEDYVSYMLSKRFRPLSLSGLNVFREHNCTYVTMGRKTDIINILPPYNGIGDHLIFKVTPNTHYVPQDSQYYRLLRSESYSYIESFIHDQGSSMPIGFCWYHVNAMRENIVKRVLSLKNMDPSIVMPLNQFVKIGWNKITTNIDKTMAPQEQLSSFALPHQYSTNELLVNEYILE